MRWARFAAMAAAAFLPAGAHSADDEEWERDLELEVPGTPGENEEQHLVRVLDEATGRPVPWATVRHFTEMTGVRAHLLRIRRCDRNGLVEIDASVWPRDGHWVVEAPGYAPAHEYGVIPRSPVELVRGRDVALRLLDGMGRPLAGAEVRVHEGCGHAPDLAKARTDGHGRFVLRGIAPRTGMLWAEAEGTRADYVEPEDVRYSAGERVAVLGAGVVAEGVVTDADGAPLAGVLVRSQQAQRGPAALTGTDGRYRLVGAKRSESLEFTHPLGESFLYFGDDPDWAPGFPLRIRLTPWEILRPDARARRSVRVRVTGPDGSPLPDVVLRCIQIDHGEVREGVTDDDPPDPGSDDDEDTGESVVSLPLGPYLIEPRSAFDDFGWNPVPFLLGADAEPPVPGVAIRATPRPRLEVVGDVPADATARLVVQGDEEPLSWDDGVLDPVHLPAEGEAVVRVELDDGVWWFPVGPAKDGVRTATVAIPPPRLLRVPGLDAWADVGLFDGPVQRTLREAEEGLATYATGDLVLRLVAEKSGLADGPGLDVPVRIDPEGSGPIDVPVPSGDARRALDVVLRVEAPDGTAFPAEFEAVDADGLDVADGETTPSSPARFPFRAGTSVRVQRDGWATLRATLDGPGERTLRWGDAAVSITALDEDGVPARFTVLLDGETFGPPGEGKETDGSAVTVRGLPAGAVEFVLLPEDEDFRGKEMRLVLRPGETRSREVVFVRR